MSRSKAKDVRDNKGCEEEDQPEDPSPASEHLKAEEQLEVSERQEEGRERVVTPEDTGYHETQDLSGTSR